MSRTLIEIEALSKQCYCTGDCKKSGAGVCIGAAMNLKKLTSYLWKIEHRSSFVFVSFSISFTLSGIYSFIEDIRIKSALSTI
jgi:hypothetical protein